MDTFRNMNGWRVRSALSDGFVRLCCTDPKDASTGFEKVSRHHSRTLVYRFSYDGLGYYYKEYVSRGWSKRLKDLFRGSWNERAARAHAQLTESGFSVAKVAAVGKKGRRRFLVTEAVTGYQPLSKTQEFLPKEAGFKLMESFGREIGRLHAEGFSHGDLQWGNTLVACDGDIYRFLFLDNDRTRKCAIGLSKRLRKKNLVQICLSGWFREFAGEQFDAFFSAYCELNPEVKKHRAHWNRRIWEKTGRRVDSKKEKNLLPGMLNELRWSCRKVWMQCDLNLESLLAEIERVYADPAVTAQRFFDTGTVRRIHTSKRADVLTTEVPGCPVCVKYFHDRRLWVRMRTFLGLAKGRRGYFAGLRLKQMGIRVPGPLACLEFRPFGPTIVVMEILKDILTVAGWFSDCQSKGGRIAVSYPLLTRFAEFAANLHRQGVYHRDFSPRNVMIQEVGNAPIFVLIDLEDVRFRTSVSRRRCIQNLARFYRESAPYLSGYILMRFLRAYIKEMGWNCSAASLAKEILRTEF